MQGTDIKSLVSEETTKSWLSATWISVTSWFTLFGTYTSGVIGIFLIARAVKFIVDTVVHGLVLYDLFGWSVKLIVAVWDSVTAFFIHKERQRREAQSKGQKIDPEIPAIPPGEPEVVSPPARAHSSAPPSSTPIYPNQSWLQSAA